MNNKITKSLIILILVLGVSLLLTTISNAASLSVSTSKSSVSPGEVFTATITLSGGAGPISASVSNGSGSGTQFLDNGSMTISCTAGSSGTVTISASGTVGDYVTETDVAVSSSKSVSIVVPTPVPTTEPTPAPTTTPKITPTPKPKVTTAPTQTPTKSSNSDLAKLEVAEGVVSPEFSSSTKEYTISVPNEVTNLSISAIPDSSKATTKIEGNEELQVGDNNITITVTAEDGSTTTYTIIAKRANAELALTALSVYYIDENGEKVTVDLSPEFNFDKYIYKLNKTLPHTVQKLIIEGISNREDANIEITGNENLQAGKNEITIKVTVQEEKEEGLEEGEEKLEEQKTYTIILEKEEEPVVVPLTTAGKIKNWFGRIGKGIAGFVTGNFEKITTIMLAVATVTFVGLTIYFAYDYKKYQALLSELAEYNKANLRGRANVALNTEGTSAENTSQTNETVQKVKEDKPEISQIRLGGRGRRFK